MKYSACRICGRGASNRSSHLIIAAHGVHTDANGRPNQPNNGTAYCDRCEDETLVIQSSLPAPPATAVEQARERAIASNGQRTHVDALIAAVRQESAALADQWRTIANDRAARIARDFIICAELKARAEQAEAALAAPRTAQEPVIPVPCSAVLSGLTCGLPVGHSGPHSTGWIGSAPVPSDAAQPRTDER